jgi:hypothetical protein
MEVPSADEMFIGSPFNRPLLCRRPDLRKVIDLLAAQRRCSRRSTTCQAGDDITVAKGCSSRSWHLEPRRPPLRDNQHLHLESLGLRARREPARQADAPAYLVARAAHVVPADPDLAGVRLEQCPARVGMSFHA